MSELRRNIHNNWLETRLIPLIDGIEEGITSIISILSSQDGKDGLLAGGSASVDSNVLTEVVSYTNSSGSAQRVNLIFASGQVSGCFKVTIGTDVVIEEYRTNPSQRTMVAGPKANWNLPAGDTIKVEVLHDQSGTKTFTAAISGR